MKIILIAVAIISIFCFAQCKKNKPDSNGLPAATQEGKNTLGFLLNGEPWMPKGFSGTGNLSIDYDPGFNNGIFGIAAYRKTVSDNTSMAIGVGDSIRLINAPYTFNIGFKGLGGAYYIDSFFCQRMSTDSSHKSSGFITISKLDRSTRIIAGSFEFTLFNANCGDTIKITNGRFDFKF